MLIPILLTVCALPFVIRLAEYSCGYGKYSWYSNEDTILDLYSYWRCYFFELLAILAAVILAFRMALYREKRKPSRIFLPLALYAGMALLSTALSVNRQASLTGNFHQFQGIVVLLGYVGMAFYTYQVLDREWDYRVLWYGMASMFVVMGIVGTFQIFKKDLLDVLPIQRLVMSKEQFAQYGGTMETVFSGNNVFLTLYNPNYAGVFLTMVVCVFFVLCYSEKERKKKAWYGFGLLAGLVLLWFTYSRSVFVSLFVALLVFLWMERRHIRRILEILVPGVLLLALLCIFFDMAGGFRFLSRIVDPKKDTSWDEIRTTEEGVFLRYEGKQYLASIEEGRPSVLFLEKATAKQPDQKPEAVREVVTQENGALVIQAKSPVTLEVWEEESMYWLDIRSGEISFFFGKDEDRYFYLTENGKQDQMVEIPKVHMGGLEYLGSGRVYIWSRVLPMLKNYLMVGSGPDTFPEVFPQNDYVGKAVYGDTAARIMEKPHNDYLLQWVQNGFLGMLALVVFYACYIRNCIFVYGREEKNEFSSRLGYGCFLSCICYMAGSFFNDSTLYTTPLFWVFIGISLAAGKSVK